MKKSTGIFMALLMSTLGISQFEKNCTNCIFEQLMEPFKTYYIYSLGYPEYYHGELRWRFTGRLPHKSLRSEYPKEIRLSCGDIDFSAEERCKGYNVSSMAINVYKQPSYFCYTTIRKCGLGIGIEETFITERIDIDWNANKTRNRFFCTIRAEYQPKMELSDIFPNDFSKYPPKAPACTCGRENVPKKTIFGSFGYEAGMHQYPFMAALVQYKGKASKFYCGASIISKHYALSSAQCKYYNNREGGTLKLRVGDHNNKKEDETNQTTTYAIEWMLEHEQWSPKDINFNDIMIIRTKDIIKFSYGVGAVCLPYSGDLFYTQGEVKILGWGCNWDNQYPDVLKEIRTKQTTDCIRPGDQNVKDRRLCTQNNTDHRYGTCTGDTGGPLIGKDSSMNRYILLGILTLQGCNNSQVEIFTRVTSYLDWIIGNVQDNFNLNCNYTAKNEENTY